MPLLKLASSAMLSGTPQRIWKPRSLVASTAFHVDQVPVESSYAIQQRQSVDRVWETRAANAFDSEIVAMSELRAGPAGLVGVVRPCRYKHYLASSQLVKEATGNVIPLAIGGHCLIVIEGRALVLRGTSDFITIPGGVIDFADCRAGQLDVADGIRREIIEELGFLPAGDLRLTGCFIGGRNLHLFFTAALLATEPRDAMTALASFTARTDEKITGWDLRPVSELALEAAHVSLAARMAARTYAPLAS